MTHIRAASTRSRRAKEVSQRDNIRSGVSTGGTRGRIVPRGPTTRRVMRRSGKASARASGKVSPAAKRSRRKFLRAFPRGFRDETYLDWERNYKWEAHKEWRQSLSKPLFARLIKAKKCSQIAATAIRIESRTNLLFSFEKMALRDAVRSADGARDFSIALFDLLHGSGSLEARFDKWISSLAKLPRRQTRVLTWPLATVFGFIAQPNRHFFFKPRVTQEAARRYGAELHYAPRPSWRVYKSLLNFVRMVRSDIGDLQPRDMIDLQSYLWVQGSDEYPD